MKKSFWRYFTLFLIVSILLISVVEAGTRGVSGSRKDDSRLSKIISAPSYKDNSDELRIKQIKKLGKKIRTSGILEVEHVHYLDGTSEEQYFLKEDNGNYYRIYFPRDENVASGSQLTVEGYVLGNEIALKDYIQSGGGVASGSLFEISAVGAQSTIVLLVNFVTNPIEPFTIEEADSLVLDDSNPESINSYIKEASYDGSFIVGDVGPRWYTVPYGPNDPLNDRSPPGRGCTLSYLAENVVAMADEDVDFLKYDRIVILTSQSHCNKIGTALSGTKSIETNDGEKIYSVSGVYRRVFIDNGVGNHEYAHMFGLRHANDYECGDDTIGENCTVIERGDVFDVMGAPLWKGHLNAYHKYILGWFNRNELRTVTRSGEYTIKPLEVSDGRSMIALKIPTKSGHSYYVEYRREIGSDDEAVRVLGIDVYNGAMIHADIESNLGKSNLLDMTPHGFAFNSQSVDSHYSVLEVGEVFHDSVNEITIETLEITDEYLKVDVAFGGQNRDRSRLKVDPKKVGSRGR